MSTVLSTILLVAVGAIVGLAGRWFFKSSSLLMDIILGIAGSVLFNLLGKVLKFVPGFLQFSWLGLAFSALGAIVAVVAYCLIQRRRSPTAA